MGPAVPLSPDTPPEVEAVYFSLLRRKSPGERILAAARMTRAVHAFALAGIRQRHPEADERERFLRLAALRLGRRLAIDAYGWDPEIRGY